MKNPLELWELSTFRAKGGLLVAVKPQNLSGAAWQVESAALVAPDGTALRVAQVWQKAEIAPDVIGDVLVTLEAGEEMPPGPSG